MKTTLALFAAVVLAGVGLAWADEAGPHLTQAAEQPKGAPKAAVEKPDPAQPTQPAESLSENRPKGRGQPAIAHRASENGAVPDGSKSDRERMVGNWFIVNDDSRRKGELWIITEDSILMHARQDGFGRAYVQYNHRLDAGKNPKQIDITVSRIKGPTVGVIKGIYVFEGDELRLCLGEMGKDRPAAFPEKPKPGEVLVLQREGSVAAPPTANDAAPPVVKGAGAPAVKGAELPAVKGAPSPTVKGRGSPTAADAVPTAKDDAGSPAATDVVPPGAQDGEPTRKFYNPEDAVKLRSKEPVTVRFKVASVQDTSRSPGTGFGAGSILLKDGGSFSVRIVPPAMNTIMRLDIEPAKHFTGKFVWVTGVVQPDSTGSSFQIKVDDLDKSQFAVLRE